MRSSRDRIARGLIINSFLATLLLQPIWVGVVATFLAVAMWMSFERLSSMFELCAEKVVDDKLASAKS
jgi:hypothetical protein